MAEKKEKEDSTVSQRLATTVTQKADKLTFLVVAVLVAAVVAIIGISLYRHYERSKVSESQNALFKGYVEAMGTLEADPQASFARVAKDFAGMPAGAQALLYQFNHAKGLGETATTETLARDFLKAYPKHEFAPQMRIALGHLLMNDGKLAEAKAEFDAVLKDGGAASYPAAALAVAQIAEMQGAADQGDPRAAEQSLSAAREAYANINATGQSARNYMPQQLSMIAEFAQLLVNDRLSGYEHPAPLGVATGAGEDNTLPVGVLAPPPAADDDAVAAPESADEPAAGEESAAEE